MSRLLNIFSGVHVQAVRYFAVGIGVVILDFLSFLLFVFFWPQAYVLANIVGKSVGSLVGFFIHKHFTFAGKQARSTILQLLLYTTLYLANMVLSSFVIYIGVEIIELSTVLSKLVADILVTANSFILSRFLVFKKKVVLH